MFVVLWKAKWKINLRKNTTHCLMLVIYTHIAKHHQKLKKNSAGSKNVLWKAKWKQNSLHRNCVCMCVFVSSSALNESSFVAKTKFFCQQKVWVLFLYKQPRVLVLVYFQLWVLWEEGCSLEKSLMMSKIQNWEDLLYAALWLRHVKLRCITTYCCKNQTCCTKG